MRRLYKVLLSLAVICLFIALIFTFSEQPGSESHSLSNEVSNKLVTWLLSYKDPSWFKNNSVEYVANLFDFPVRKLAHICVYMGLGFIVTFSLWFIFDYDLHFWHVFVALGVVFLTGCADEFVQSFSGGRGATFKDALIDTFGGALGVYAQFMIRDFIRHLTNGFKKIGQRK